MGHEVEVHLLDEGAVQAVCLCGWRSEVYGTSKTTLPSLPPLAKRS